MMHRQSGHSAALSQQSAQSLAQGLGWFSIALGLTEMLAPRSLTRSLGMEGHETLVQAYGLREIATASVFCRRNSRRPGYGAGSAAMRSISARFCPG
jgi:hypothetical protein